MALIQCEKLVPEVYVNESRDFQLLCRAFNTILNSSKWYIDGIRNTLDTKNISSNLLPLLKTKVGFFDGENLDYDSLRLILDAFPFIMKYKGSLLGLKRAIQLYFQVQKINTTAYIQVINTVGGNIVRWVSKEEIESTWNEDIPGEALQHMLEQDWQYIMYHFYYPEDYPLADSYPWYDTLYKEDVYMIDIGILYDKKINIDVLKEICKYIIPTGYVLYIHLFGGEKKIEDLLQIQNKAHITLITNDYNSMVASTDIHNNGINTQSVDTVDIINNLNYNAGIGITEEYDNSITNQDYVEPTES